MLIHFDHQRAISLDLGLPDQPASAHAQFTRTAAMHTLVAHIARPATTWARSCPLLWANPLDRPGTGTGPTILLRANGATAPFLAITPRQWCEQAPSPFTARARPDGLGFLPMLHILPTCTGPFSQYQGQKTQTSRTFHFPAGSDEDALLVFSALANPNALWAGNPPEIPALLCRATPPDALRAHARSVQGRIAAPLSIQATHAL